MNQEINTPEDINDNNNVAAINNLENFIDAVIKQRDNGEIPSTFAQEMINDAQNIINLIISG